MKITDLNLLEIDLFDGDKLVYNGMCEDIPDIYKDKKIKIKSIDGKKIQLELE